METFVYERRRPERTTLYAVVRDHLETLVAATEDANSPLPRFVRAELEGYLECGLLSRGFAHLRCEACGKRRLVAFSCKGRGFCPSCTGRRMAQTAANVMDHVLPAVPLRQWVLTVPYPMRTRLAYNKRLLGEVVRVFSQTVLAFYKRRCGASGALSVVQRTSSDLRLNPHVHAVFLDGGYIGEQFVALGHLHGREVHRVLVRARRRIERVLAKGEELEDDGHAPLLSSVAGHPPAGPALRRGGALVADMPPHRLCVQDEGYTLHAATTAGDPRGREALVRYVLRPPVAQERVLQAPDGLVRIVLKKPFSDGTVAIDMDPLSLLTRLCAAVPAPRFHTVRYCGVLASASKLRKAIVPKPKPEPEQGLAAPEKKAKKVGSRYWPWAELMARTFHIDVCRCPRCQGRLLLVAMVHDPKSIARFLAHLGEPFVQDERAPARGPPYFHSPVVRRLLSARSVA